MNWYKISQIENFPTWLGEKLREETNKYRSLKDPTYPGLKFDSQDINLIKLWIEQANPNLDNYTLQEAKEKSQTWYRATLPLSMSLKKEDINTLGVYAALTTNYYNRLNIDEDSIKVLKIEKTYDKPEVHHTIFNNVVTVQFKCYNIKENENQLWQQRLVTKDGKHFAPSMGEMQKTL